MSNENELLEPLATEAGQQAIVRAINNLSSLEYAVRAEHAATTAMQKADEASVSATAASGSATTARNWATKMDTYVDTETITIPAEEEGEEDTTETVELFSARYYALMAQEIYNNLQFDSVPTENSTNLISSGAIYDALDLKADKSTTYTKTEVDTALATKQDTLTIDNSPTENSTNLVKSGGVYAALEDKADNATTLSGYGITDAYTKSEVDSALGNVQSTLTFDNIPTQNSNNPVKSGGIYTALLSKADSSSVPTKVSDLTNDSGFITGVAWNDVTSKPTFATVATSGSYTDLTDKPTIPSAYTLPTASSSTLGGIKVGTNLSIDNNGVLSASGSSNVTVDSSITENSTNPVTSAAIYAALQNIDIDSDIVSGITEEKILDSKQPGQAAWSAYNTTSNLDNYDFIRLVCRSSVDNSIVYKGIWLYSQLKSFYDGNHYLTVRKFENKDLNFYFSNTSVSISFNGTTTNTVNCDVYGLKISKSLSEQMYSNVLYENASGIESGNITLIDSYENYDFFEVFYKLSGWGSSASCLVSKSEFWDENCLVFNDGKYFGLAHTDSTNFTIGGNGLKLTKIIGHKMAKGGYSGIVSDARMTVKSGTITTTSAINQGGNFTCDVTFDSPMPDTNYQVFLQGVGGTSGASQTCLLVGDDNATKTVNGFRAVILAKYGNVSSGARIDWIAIRPNSYTREGMVEDVLFSNASGVNSGTINLSGNISDYDLIEIFTSQNNVSSYGRTENIYTSSQLIETMNNNHYMLITGMANGGNTTSKFIKFHLASDNSIVIDSHDSNQDGQLLHKITGIKFGRYVSGVAVDNTVTQNSNAVVTSGAVYDALQNYTPSGGGSGGSIVVDAVPTQNSTNAVQSGGVYDALQNISGGFEVFEIDDTKLTPNANFTCNQTFYNDTADSVLASHWANDEETFLKNSIPCVSGQPRYGDGYVVAVVSPIQKGTEIYAKKKNGTSINPTITTGSITMPNGDLLYYSITDLVIGTYASQNLVPSNRRINQGDTSTQLARVQRLIEASQIALTEDLSYNVDSTYIQEIQDQIVVKFNGELYYRCKETPVSNHIYFYSLDKKSQMEVKMLDFNLNSSIMTIKENVPIRSSLELDTTPTENSTNAITSGAVYTALQNAGGGSSVTVDSTITQGGTNPVEGGAIYTALEDKADKSTTYTKTEVDTALGSKQGTLTFDTTPTQNSTNPVTSGGVYTALQNLPTGTGDVTTNTDQNITGTKTFVGSKKVGFKQSAANDKLGFTLFGNTGTERGYLEFNPTNTVDGVAGLMTLGNYATSAASLTQVGFRRYSNISGQSGAYNLLMPMVADARTPFSLTTTYQNFYLPLGFTDGTTTVKTAKTGVVDLSPLLASLEARIAALEGN